MHRNLDLKDAQEILYANLTSIYSLSFPKCKTRINKCGTWP